MSSKAKRRKSTYVSDDDESNTMDDDQDREVGLSKDHQLLLQYLMHARMVTKLDLSRIHGKLFNDSESMSDSISNINRQINPLKMDIKQVKCDISGETCFVVIHTTADMFFPKCCIFSKHQLDYLKEVLTSIVLAGGKIGKMEALNLSKQPMTKSDADECLGMFINEKLLLEINDNKQLCLSPLSIVEFAPYFTACLPDNLTSCDLCKQLVFVGKNCKCGMKFHYHCASKWINRQSSCPKCGEMWTNDCETE